MKRKERTSGRDNSDGIFTVRNVNEKTKFRIRHMAYVLGISQGEVLNRRFALVDSMMDRDDPTASDNQHADYKNDEANGFSFDDQFSPTPPIPEQARDPNLTEEERLLIMYTAARADQLERDRNRKRAARAKRSDDAL